MRGRIAADAGPLIGLARAGLLDLLQKLYGTAAVPPAVLEELRLGEDRPGSRVLRTAHKTGWLVEVRPKDLDLISEIGRLVGPGEAAAIALAEERGWPILLDERRGRGVARLRGVSVIGTGGVLLLAKEGAHLSRVGPSLRKLADAGYRLAPTLQAEILRLAGE